MRRGSLRGRSGAALVGGVIVAVYLCAAAVGAIVVVAPQLSHLWAGQDLGAALTPPFSSLAHPLGTDNLGRDLFWRLLGGVAISFTIGFAITAISLFVGVLLGLFAGYLGGVVDGALGVIVDVVWGFPAILVAIMVAGIRGPGAVSIIIAIAALSWAGIARTIRGQALELRNTDFIRAAEVLGVSKWRIVSAHLVPNVMGTVLVLAAYYAAVSIIIEAGVSYLGLGVQQPMPSLGEMLAEGRSYLRLDPWLTLAPGAVLAVAVFAFNLLGDGLRDELDPRLSRPQG